MYKAQASRSNSKVLTLTGLGAASSTLGLGGTPPLASGAVGGGGSVSGRAVPNLVNTTQMKTGHSVPFGLLVMNAIFGTYIYTKNDMIFV